MPFASPGLKPRSTRLGVLVDLAHGAAAVSDELGIPHAPGFSELAAGRAGFEDVVQVDNETLLQMIPAGDRAVRVVTKLNPNGWPTFSTL